MRTSAVFWELNNSRETNAFYNKCAFSQLFHRILNGAEEVEIRNVFGYGLWDEGTKAIMASLQGSGVICIPLFGDRTQEDLNKKVAMEMALFAKDNPGCKIFLIPKAGSDYEDIAGTLIEEDGVALVLVVEDKDRVSDVLRVMPRRCGSGGAFAVFLQPRNRATPSETPADDSVQLFVGSGCWLR